VTTPARIKPPTISVVLPTYNGSRYIRESVESVLAQDTDDFDLIICDDGSSDKTWSLLQPYAGPRCRLLRNERNRGLFPTLNRLIGEAPSAWVHLWSQDDRMLPGCLRRTCDFAAEHPEVGMIYSRMRFIDEAGNFVSEGKDDPTPSVLSSVFAARIMYFFGSISGNIANVSLRTDVFRELGPFREDLKVSGDYEYWVRLSGQYPIGFLPEPLIELREHRGQFSRQHTSALQFITENREIRQILRSRLPEREHHSADRYTRWVTQVNGFHQAIRYAASGDFRRAMSVLGVLKREAALLPLAGRWLLSANGRTLSRPRIDIEKQLVSF
jgi:hypothetical protein